jgi:multidrug efflux pump subunit AcrA (membrane-fusion protein)
MRLTSYLKPVFGVVIVAALGAGYYWVEHRPRAEEKAVPNKALVIVARTTNACFSDMVRVTGFIVPRREAVVGVDQEGSKVTDLFVREGDVVTENQELARLSAPPANPQNPNPPKPGPVSLRASAAGLVTHVNTIIGAPDLIGRVRLVSPEINRATQLGHVRITLTNNPSLRVGMFARASIDAKRSCGLAVPRSAIDHLTVQVVKGNTVETRKVKVGLVSDTATEILEGLDVGEIVVADAGTSLHDGDQIKTMFADELDRVRVR